MKVSVSRVHVCLILTAGLVSTADATPPGPSEAQARAAIEQAGMLRDALELHITSAPVMDQDQDGIGPRRVARPVHRRPRPRLERPRPALPRSEVRSRQHARRSLARISRQLDTAAENLERNPSLSLHRVDLALHELRKVERRLAITLQPVEVLP